MTMNTIQHHCIPNRGLDTALDTVQRFRKRHSILPGTIACEALFAIAWRKRFYNSSKVIWKYACLEGLVTYKMKRYVSKSLLRNPQCEPSNHALIRGNMWRTAAGKLVVGVNVDTKSKPQSSQPITQHPSSLLDAAPTGELDAPLLFDYEEQRRRILRGNFAEDLALAHCFHINSSLDDLLRKAMAMDRQWALEDIPPQNGFQWILQHSISIPLKTNYPARFLTIDHRGRNWGHYLAEQHPLKFQRDEGSEVDFRSLKLDKTQEHND